jgi:glycosyltransferase involved in cell wall biosynthesis
MKKNSKILIFTHQSDESGAPRSLLNILEESKLNSYSEVYTVILRKGSLAKKIENVSNKSMIIDGFMSRTIIGRILSIFLIFKFIIKYGPFECALINSSVNLRALLICSVLRQKFVVYVRESEGMIKNFLGNFRRYLFRYASSLVCVSRDTQKWVDKYSRGVEVITIHNGINFQSTTSNIQSYDDRKKSICLSYVGFLDKRKGIDYFTDLVSYLIDKTEHINFMIIGEVRDDGCLQRLNDINEKTNRLHFTGVVDDIYPHLNKSHCVLMLSREEALPRVVLEASSVGIPTIGYDVNGTKELLPDDYRYLFPVGDLDGVKESLLSVTPLELSNLGGEVYKNCKSNFNRQTLVHKLFKLMIDLK